jgi:hypothetical protein
LFCCFFIKLIEIEIKNCFGQGARPDPELEAQQAQGKGKTGKADWAINQIQKLFALESKL